MIAVIAIVDVVVVVVVVAAATAEDALAKSLATEKEDRSKGGL